MLLSCLLYNFEHYDFADLTALAIRLTLTSPTTIATASATSLISDLSTLSRLLTGSCERQQKIPTICIFLHAYLIQRRMAVNLCYNHGCQSKHEENNGNCSNVLHDLFGNEYNSFPRNIKSTGIKSII